MIVRRIKQLASTEEACAIEVVRKAIADLDFELAVAVLYARVKRGHAIPIELVCEVLPRLGFPMHAVNLCALAVGERSTALLRLVEREAFPDDSVGRKMRAIAIYMAWETRSGDAIRERLFIEREVLRYDARADSDDVVARILEDLDVNDGDASRCLAIHLTIDTPVELVSLRTVTKLTRAQLDDLPDMVQSDAPLAKLTKDIAVNLGSRGVGRNDPCPCESGLKFKRCHGDPDKRLVGPDARPTLSPSSGVPRTIEDAQLLPLTEVAALRLRRVEIGPLMALLERLLKYRLWAQADRILDEVDGRQIEQGVRDSFRGRVVVQALRCGELEIVSRHVRHLHSKAFSMVKLQVMAGAAISSRAPDALDQLVASIDEVMRDDSGVFSANLAAILEPIVPSLAILLGRNCMSMESAIQWERLLPVVEGARIRLSLSPGDRAAALLAVHKAAARTKLDDTERTRLAAKAKAEADSIRALLAESQRLHEDAERRAEGLASALREQTSQPRQSVEVPADPAIVREMRSKIDDLQVMVRERNEELASIRRRLPSERAPESSVTSEDGTEELDAEWEQDEQRDRRLSVPEWSDAAASALHLVPSHVAREALRTVADLASGERPGWRAVKRPKRTTTPLLMIRIGLHHRLLFRSDGSALRVVELVSRESLDLTLKRHSR